MLDINITRFVAEAAPMDYAASAAEIGADAGADTWRAACDDAPDWNFLDTDDKRDEARNWLQGFGAWSQEEIADMTDTQLNALLIQFIAGDIRNGNTDRIFRTDCGTTYFTIGD